jgi:hypothetical protein
MIQSETARQSVGSSGSCIRANSWALAMAGQCLPPNCASKARAARLSPQSVLSSISRRTRRPDTGVASRRISSPLPSLWLKATPISRQLAFLSSRSNCKPLFSIPRHVVNTIEYGILPLLTAVWGAPQWGLHWRRFVYFLATSATKHHAHIYQPFN